jgi:hypothetical protein
LSSTVEHPLDLGLGLLATLLEVGAESGDVGPALLDHAVDLPLGLGQQPLGGGDGFLHGAGRLLGGFGPYPVGLGVGPAAVAGPPLLGRGAGVGEDPLPLGDGAPCDLLD